MFCPKTTPSGVPPTSAPTAARAERSIPSVSTLVANAPSVFALLLARYPATASITDRGT